MAHRERMRNMMYIMKRISLIIFICFCIWFFFSNKAEVAVMIDTTSQYQTILGWGADADWDRGDDIPRHVSRKLKDQILNDAVNDLGLTQMRFLAGFYSHLWEPVNDDGDPDHINWSAFGTSWYDAKAADFWLPLKNLIEANGDSLGFNLSLDFGARHGLYPWIIDDPDEYAEHVISMLLYLKNTYDLTANYVVLQNEPSGHATAAWHANIIKVLGPKLQAVGLPTKISFCDGINASRTWNYINALRNDPDIWQHVGLLSYHLYGSTDPYRSYIRDFGISKGILTGQTENMNAKINNLYEDLTLGGVSYWGVRFAFAWYGNTGIQYYKFYAINHNLNSFSRHPEHWRFRQVMHYVRPGAIRVEATSSGSVRPLAFVRNGKVTVVLINGGWSRTLTVNNLPAGKYGLSQSVGYGVYQELGIQDSTGTLTVNMPSNSVLTIYPYAGTNLPPNITEWKANPRYIYVPTSSVTLSATTTDPELDPIFYTWSITDQPVGANVILSTPDDANTLATGLTVAGHYIFRVTASDGTNTTTREVLFNVYSGNQPPFIIDVHNRNPSIVALPMYTSTELQRKNAIDLEGDPLTHQWRVVSQPPGATVSLSNPTATTCKVSNMTVAGDYIFEIEVSDPTHTITEKYTVTVYPPKPGILP